MSVLHINGGRRLEGSITVQGSKNSALPIMAASLLARREVLLKNCPRLSDIEAAMEILRYLGCRAQREDDGVYIDPRGMCRRDIPDPLMRRMRSSVIFLGPILARMGRAELSVPGGCELGPRPIDMHLEAMKSLGASVEVEGGSISCRGGKLRGAKIHLPFPSVGATENAMLAAAGAKGETVIINAAREPEIEDLQRFLRLLGVPVCGAGSSIVTVQGMGETGGGEFAVSSDRIVCATYMSAAAAAGGDISLLKADASALGEVIGTLRRMGCDIRINAREIRIKCGRLKAPPPVVTKPYPGFPTDAQPPLMAAALTAEGTSVFVENIFQNRYRHVQELLRMGADIRTVGRVAVVCGGKRLRGAAMEAPDLRGGAALVTAALAAEGSSTVGGLHHIERGYESIESALSQLGADICRKD